MEHIKSHFCITSKEEDSRHGLSVYGRIEKYNVISKDYSNLKLFASKKEANYFILRNTLIKRNFKVTEIKNYKSRLFLDKTDDYIYEYFDKLRDM